MNAGYQSKSISWKYFMFHEMTLKLYFMKCSESKISLPLIKDDKYFIFIKVGATNAITPSIIKHFIERSIVTSVGYNMEADLGLLQHPRWSTL